MGSMVEKPSFFLIPHSVVVVDFDPVIHPGLDMIQGIVTYWEDSFDSMKFVARVERKGDLWPIA